MFNVYSNDGCVCHLDTKWPFRRKCIILRQDSNFSVTGFAHCEFLDLCVENSRHDSRKCVGYTVYTIEEKLQPYIKNRLYVPSIHLMLSDIAVSD